jgi:hypothetical protein
MGFAKSSTRPCISAAIEVMPKTNYATFLHTKQGNPRSAKSLGGDFRQWCDKAGLPKHCSLHGLRKGCLRILAEAGATSSNCNRGIRTSPQIVRQRRWSRTRRTKKPRRKSRPKWLTFSGTVSNLV